MQAILALLMLLLTFNMVVLCVSILLQADILILIFVMLVLFLPCIVLFREISIRNKYPVRVRVVYVQGEKDGEKKLYYRDRLGYIDIVDAKGKRTGAKEWVLYKNSKVVVGFCLKDIEEGTEMIFGEFLRIGLIKKMATVYAVGGADGYEFYPARFNTDTHEYTPIFDPDVSSGLARIQDDIETRNKKEAWWKENVMALLQTGLQAIVIILLIVLIIQLADWSMHAPQCRAVVETVVQNATTTAAAAGQVKLPFGGG